MIKSVLVSISIAIALYNWNLFIPKSWYESSIGDIQDIVSRYGYVLEEHQVQTEDGYLLKIHRIPAGRNESCCQKKEYPPVFLMHGLACSSVDWIINGPNKSMALILADAGYDVWIGNNRGNTYSRRHLTLDPDTQKKEFFDYSYHEIGLYDLPAMIDYVLIQTGYRQLTYIGYSEGFTSFLVMGSLRPEYNEKILLMNAFAPVTTLYRVKSLFFNFLGLSDLILKVPEYFGWYEVFPHDEASLLKLTCAVEPICRIVFTVIGSSNEQLPDMESQSLIRANFPAGISLKQLSHYVQGLKTGIFGQYDYGSSKNLQRYGTKGVPVYDITKVTAPIILYYGEDDVLVNNDVLLNTVARELPNVVKYFQVPYPRFNHLDFIWGKDVDYLTKEALANIFQYNTRQL